jgi:asparagine synthase (glutamine-hydrolysing)
MCGIAGLATSGPTPSRELVAAMCDAIVHRGPDGSGYLVDEGVGLGMRRLAIIDLVTGDQPVTNGHGRVQAVFNGEIYNYRELRAELGRRGHVFKSQGDSEVIPHLYEEYGVEFLSRLNGMFAIALWDTDRRRLLLARDRAGIKPLLYAVRDGAIYFGSEVKSLLAAGASQRRIDPDGVDQLLTFEYTIGPRTMFRDVHKLPAGGWLTWERGRISRGRFWNPPIETEPVKGTEAEIAERLKATVVTAVSRQLVSDVPLGAFLSGGIDSSILVAAMTEASTDPPKTYSVGFGDASYNELRYARLVAQHCRTDHHEELLTPDYLAILPDVVAQLDQPIADFSVFPTLLVSRMARRHVTVALGGDGGDELFAGYDTYVADRMAARTIDMLPRVVARHATELARLVPLERAKRGFGNQLRRFLEGAALPREWQHVRWMVFLTDAQKAALYTPEFYAATRLQSSRLVEQMLSGRRGGRLAVQGWTDLRHYLVEDILPKVDMMSMAPSLEARVPYLDNDLVDLALAIPDNLKVRKGVRKYILKRAFAGSLPPEILSRGKEGFSMPMKNWLNQEWNPLMHELLCAENLQADGLFRPAGVGLLMRQHEAGTHNHSHALWALMVFQLWKQRFGASA